MGIYELKVNQATCQQQHNDVYSANFRKLQEDPPMGVSGAPTEDNILKWDAIIFGPDDTPFEGGTFKLTMEFTDKYPHDAPKVKFVTKLFHPNIYQDGSICLDILSDKWSPTFDISITLHSIQSLLDDPNPHSPANSLAAELFMTNKSEYIRRVASSVEKSWNEEDPDDNDSLYDDDIDTDFVPIMEDVVAIQRHPVVYESNEDIVSASSDFGLKLLFTLIENDVIGPLFNADEDNILVALFDELTATSQTLQSEVQELKIWTSQSLARHNQCTKKSIHSVKIAVKMK